MINTVKYYFSIFIIILLSNKVLAQVQSGSPVWPLSVQSNEGALKVDWRQDPPVISEIPNTAPSTASEAVAAYNECGEIAFYLLHSGSNNANNLFVYNAEGLPLLTNNTPNGPGLNAIASKNEIQIVKNPGTSNQWFIIYSINNSSYSAPARILYSRVQYDEVTDVFQVMERDIALQDGQGVIHTYTHGKAVSQTAFADPSKHFLYLIKRVPNQNTVQVHRFTISNNSIAFRDASNDVTATYWSLSVFGSDLELNIQGTRLVYVNRNESHDVKDILIFDTNNLTGSEVTIRAGDLVVQPDFQVLLSEERIKDLGAGTTESDPLLRLRFLINFELKLSGLQLSPSGRYIYVTGGGFAGSGNSHITYLAQIDLEGTPNTNGSFDVRLQIQKPAGVHLELTGAGGPISDPNWRQISSIELSYDGNIYFTKSNENRLFVIPNPDDPMPQMLVPGEVDLSTPTEPNIDLGDVTGNFLPNGIDGFVYFDNTLPLPNGNFSVSPGQPEIALGEQVEVTLSNFINDISYTIDWGDGTIETLGSATVHHNYSSFGNYELMVEAENSAGCKDIVLHQLRVVATGPLCETTISASAGAFKIDKATGKIVFDMEDCPVQLSLGCISNNPDPLVLTNVIAASATTFSDTWSYAAVGYSFPGENDFDKGEKGKWRAKSAYAYNEKIENHDKNYNTGTYNMELFSWADPSSNNPDKWLKASTIDLYSPHGEALQDHNLLGIYNTTKLGYDNALPYLTAQNASYKTVFFESFENTYPAAGETFEDHYKPLSGESETTSLYAHSGKKSVRLTGTPGLKRLTLASMQYAAGGMTIKCWMRFSNPSVYNSLEDFIAIKVAGTSPDYKKTVARAGEWMLYEVKFTNLAATTLYTPVINFSGSGDIWIDDIRIQPSESQMMAYVYDPATFRLLTVFDDQHFGLYYQYNAEGQLVRKLKETERGVKTIQETQYNVPTTTLLEN